MAGAEKTTSRSEGQQAPAAPSISLPKGGGAVHASNVDLGQASERNRARPSGATSGVTTEYLYDLLTPDQPEDNARERPRPLAGPPIPTTLVGHITRIEDGTHNGIGAP